MKAAHILASMMLLPSFTYALVGISWSLEGAPARGVSNITFPMLMPETPHVSGYYYAQQYSFVGISGAMGYTGLQPRPDNGTGSVIHAVFSSFTKGSTTDDANCHSGADGGAGVSCSVEANLSYADEYELVVTNTANTTWTGTLVNKCNCEEVHIGSYTLPEGVTGITNYQVGFMEYYPNNGPNPKPCNELPYGAVTFGTPTTDTQGMVGKLDSPYEYGDCVGKVDFEK